MSFKQMFQEINIVKGWQNGLSEKSHRISLGLVEHNDYIATVQQKTTLVIRKNTCVCCSHSHKAFDQMFTEALRYLPYTAAQSSCMLLVLPWTITQYQYLPLRSSAEPDRGNDRNDTFSKTHAFHILVIRSFVQLWIKVT